MTLLPDWLRHLPETVATSIPTLEPDLSEPEPESATESKPEPAPTAAPAARGEASADAATQRQRFVARAGDVDRQSQGVERQWGVGQVGGGRFAADSRVGAGDCRRLGRGNRDPRSARRVEPTDAGVGREAFRQGIRPEVARDRLCSGTQDRHLAAGCADGQGGHGGCHFARLGSPRNWPTVWPRSRPQRAIRPRVRHGGSSCWSTP